MGFLLLLGGLKLKTKNSLVPQHFANDQNYMALFIVMINIVKHLQKGYHFVIIYFCYEVTRKMRKMFFNFSMIMVNLANH